MGMHLSLFMRKCQLHKIQIKKVSIKIKFLEKKKKLSARDLKEKKKAICQALNIINIYCVLTY